jgi:isoleucyl-tRNA synthetase
MEKKEYKQTLLMPQTDFPMRANLPVRELDIQKFWADTAVYEKMLQKRKDATPFILHDGPPYANGNLHVGHALNKILKDMINRRKLLTGHYVQYIAGWDTHGLPIEHAVVKSGVNRKEMSVAAFRAICQDYALEQIDIQMKQFDRLGIFTNWQERYVTLYPEFEKEQLKVFAQMVAEGLIYKGFKTVYWSPTSESALAEAEVEYQDVRSPSMYIAFDLSDDKGKLTLERSTALVIWTTTPWTIPANTAITIGAEFEYVVVRVEGHERDYIVAKELLASLAEKFGWENYTVHSTYTGDQLEGIVTRHPLVDREAPVLLGEHVRLDAGTGLVHTAPGYGEDDFAMSKKYDIPVLSITDEKGVMTAEAGKYAGLFYADANKAVGEDLTANGAALKLEWITHSYPHDWRTKQPIIYWVTNQWFASIDKIRPQLLAEIEQNVKWFTPWGQVRLANMMKTRDDWTISRQRVWGVPIPIFYTEAENPIMDPALVEHVAELFGQYGSNIWFEKDAKELLPAGYTHPESPNGIFTKEEDIMDVWFDSGTSYAYVTAHYNLDYPLDMYLEGSDQYRGWFNSSLITGVASRGHAPYKSVVSAGFVLDGKGRKMSKSLGNTVDPQKMTKLFGADILRLWVASVDYTNDVRISDDIMKQVAESYRKIRNNFRFMLGNLADFQAKSDTIAYSELAEVDQYVLQTYYKYVREVNDAYERYDFVSIYQLTLNLITHTLSAFYLDYAKDILYCNSENSTRRRQIQTVIYEILDGLVRILAPIIAHTSEEVWQQFRTLGDGLEFESVFETTAPATKTPTVEDERIIAKWSQFMAVRDDVLKALEEARNEDKIGKSLDAQVFLALNETYAPIIASIEPEELRRLLMVSRVNLSAHEEAKTYNTGAIHATTYDAAMCPRCWNRYEDEELAASGLCLRCRAAIDAME